MQKLLIVTSASLTLHLSCTSIEEARLLANIVLGNSNSNSNSNSIVNIELTNTETHTRDVIKIIW